MNAKIKIFVICYLKEQFEKIKEPIIPWDNRANLKPNLFEYPIFKEAFSSDLTKDIDYYGLLSPKFESKSKISFDDFLNWIEVEHQKNPSDIYFINPCPVNESLFVSTLQHGNNCHPGLLALIQRHLSEYPNLENMIMDCNTFALCNYFVANKKFWKSYIDFVDKFLLSIENNEEDKNLMYNISANYGPNQKLPYFTFVVERLFSIFLYIHSSTFKSSHYIYSKDEIVKKTGLTDEMANEVLALSILKNVGTNTSYKQLLHVWAHFRNKVASQNSYLFLLE